MKKDLSGKLQFNFQVGATIVIPARAPDSSLLFSVPGLMENQAMISNNPWKYTNQAYIAW